MEKCLKLCLHNPYSTSPNMSPYRIVKVNPPFYKRHWLCFCTLPSNWFWFSDQLSSLILSNYILPSCPSHNTSINHSKLIEFSFTNLLSVLFILQGHQITKHNWSYISCNKIILQSISSFKLFHNAFLFLSDNFCYNQYETIISLMSGATACKCSTWARMTSK